MIGSVPDNFDDLVAEVAIRKRSYEIWLQEGCPDGRDLDHWLRAKDALREEREQQLHHSAIRCGTTMVYFWDHYG